MIKIYDKEFVQKDIDVYLALVEKPDGIMVVAVNPHTGEPIHQGNLIRFNNDGTVTRMHRISPKIGVTQDPNGRIKMRVK